ncbi:MAG: ATP-binding protein [Syntrophomonas sp.]
MKNKVALQLKASFSSGSLRLQLLSRSLLILAGLLALIGILQYIFMQNVILQNKAGSLRSQIMSVTPEALDQIATKADNKLMDLRPIFIPEANLAFIDEKGEFKLLWSDIHNNVNPPQLSTQEYQQIMNLGNDKNQEVKRAEQPAFRKKPDKPDKQEQNYIITNNGGTEQLVVLQPVFSVPEHKMLGLMQISTPTGPLKELLIGQLIMFFLLSLIAMLLGLLAFLPVLKRTLVPLSNMVDTAQRIDAGNLDSRFPTRQGQIEIDLLAESFNGMLERLESSFEAERDTQEQMRRFIADASHELRTPLTSIHGFLEVLLRGAANQPDQLDKALRSMHSESQRLNKLVHDLLLLSKIDRAPNVELEEGYLDSVIRDMEPQLHILAGNRKLDLFIEKEMKCNYNTDQMKQVILNIFHNAVQYTDPESGHIQISLVKKDKGVQLSVQDNGPGINDEHLARIFDRFYRSDSSRTRKFGGAGLGLSITKSIVEAHGGTISVISREKEGTTFQVWLPENND